MTIYAAHHKPLILFKLWTYHTNTQNSLHRAHSLQVTRGQGFEAKAKATGLQNQLPPARRRLQSTVKKTLLNNNSTHTAPNFLLTSRCSLKVVLSVSLMTRSASMTSRSAAARSPSALAYLVWFEITHSGWVNFGAGCSSRAIVVTFFHCRKAYANT